jgi:hypothetical protein
MVVVLRDHVAQGAAAHLLECFATNAPAAPGNLLPHKDAERITEFNDPPRLLVVGEANKVGAHVFDKAHLLLQLVVRHSRSVSSMILVTVSSLK